MLKQIIFKLKRLFFKIKNADPYYKCPVFNKEGCSHVDGLLCNFTDCNMINKHFKDKWITCSLCMYEEQCCNKNYGFGCDKGKEIGT
jgi:hypothetical protein